MQGSGEPGQTKIQCGRWRSTMGDKGGRKDKEKGQKQNASKQKKKARIKEEKQPKSRA